MCLLRCCLPQPDIEKQCVHGYRYELCVEIGLCEMLHPVWYPEARDQHVEGKSGWRGARAGTMARRFSDAHPQSHAQNYLHLVACFGNVHLIAGG